MNDIDKDFMREEYTEKDVCDIKKNPYAGKFSLDEKNKAYDNALKAMLREDVVNA